MTNDHANPSGPVVFAYDGSALAKLAIADFMAITLSGANPATHVRVTVALTGTSWGTSIRLLAWGLPLNQPCRLIVRSRTGGTEVTGVWDAWSAGPVSIPASAAWRPADISSLQVATTSRNLVTVTAGRPGAHVPPSSVPNGSRQ